MICYYSSSRCNWTGIKLGVYDAAGNSTNKSSK
uniref:Uncharacterized protein n=1 Tax=Arundo donax TaxID=35708 RepID=A0A0A8YEN5_ARUDO